MRCGERNGGARYGGFEGTEESAGGWGRRKMVAHAGGVLGRHQRLGGIGDGGNRLKRAGVGLRCSKQLGGEGSGAVCLIPRSWVWSIRGGLVVRGRRKVITPGRLFFSSVPASAASEQPASTRGRDGAKQAGWPGGTDAVGPRRYSGPQVGGSIRYSSTLRTLSRRDNGAMDTESEPADVEHLGQSPAAQAERGGNPGKRWDGQVAAGMAGRYDMAPWSVIRHGMPLHRGWITSRGRRTLCVRRKWGGQSSGTELKLFIISACHIQPRTR